MTNVGQLDSTGVTWVFLKKKNDFQVNMSRSLSKGAERRLPPLLFFVGDIDPVILYHVRHFVSSN